MRSPRTSAALVVAIAAGICIAVASPALAGRSTIRDNIYGRLKVSVSPDTQLQNSQFVKLTWRGLPRLRVVYFRQCTAHPRRVARDCTAIYPDVGFTNLSGAGTLYEPVTEGTVLSQNHSHFDCDHVTPCTLGVFTSARLNSGKRVPIQFGPTPDGCPEPVGAAIVGGGGDEAGQLMYNWGLDLCAAPRLTSVNYIPANSIDGRTNFINGLSDFAVTGTPFSAAQRVQLQHKHRTFAYAPIAASGLVLAYKVFDQDPAQAEPGSQITNLKLTPSLVAQIFTGSIPNWEVDAQIRHLNPGDIFPPTIFPLVRGDHSDANLLFTSWLTATAGKGLPKGWPAPSSNYPLKYLTPSAAIVGGNNLAYAIADPASVNNSNDYFAVGYIGFIDSSQAHFYGLPTARIENAAGKFVRATPATITAALEHATKNPDGVTVRPNFKTRAKKAYPMPVVDYATAPTDSYNGAKGATLRAFLQYAVTTGQQTLAPGYTPLPANMLAQTTRVIPEIPATIPVTTGPPGGSSTSPSGGYTGGAPSGYTGPPSHGINPGGTSSPPAKKSSSLPTAMLGSSDGRLVLPALSGMSALGVLGGLVLLGMGDGRRRARVALAGFVRDLPRPRMPRR
jgi:ABC-type phosphate transport system substrate-binding protein